MLEESMLSAHDLADLQALPEVATIECHDTLGSTMDRGRELAAAGSVPLPALVLAMRQQAGRGRRGASWWQPPGSLAMTLVLESGASAATGPLPLWAPACGLAVVETVHALLPTLSPAVRWPNDIELHGRKLAGILVEATTTQRVLIGIGMNTTGSAAAAPAGLADRLTTLPDATGQSLPHRNLLAVLVPRLLATIAEVATPVGRADVVRRYRAACSLTGHPVQLFDVLAEPVAGLSPAVARRQTARLSGLCRGIDEDGRLLVETAEGLQAVIAGSLTDPATIWTAAD